MSIANTQNDVQDDKNLLTFEFPDPDNIEGEVKQVEETAPQTTETVEEPTTPEAVVEEAASTEETDPDAPSEAELASYSATVQKRIKELTRKRHEERRAREAAEQERQQLHQKLNEMSSRMQQLEQSASAGQSAVVIQAQKLAETEFEQAKAKLLSAYETASPAEFIAAQEAFNEAQAKLSRIKAYAAQNPLQQRPKNDNVQSQQAPTPTTQPVTPAAPSEKLKGWLNENKWFGKHEALTNFARGLHFELVSSGVNPESDYYYRTLTEKTRNAFPQEFKTPANPDDTPRGKTVVAPAGRTTQPRRITLNERQVALANRLGIPVAEYARELMKQEKTSG